MSEQFDFDFDSPTPKADPLASWRDARAAEAVRLSERFGVPLGREVEVELISGTVLQGVLSLADEGLWNDMKRDEVELEIDGVRVRLKEVASIVRI